MARFPLPPPPPPQLEVAATNATVIKAIVCVPCVRPDTTQLETLMGSDRRSSGWKYRIQARARAADGGAGDLVGVRAFTTFVAEVRPFSCRNTAGAMPTMRLKARLNADSDP